MIDTEAKPLDGSEDVVGRFGPPEGPGVFVVLFDEGPDIGFELAGGGVHAALQLLARQFGEPAFDLIDPRRRRRRKVDMPVRPPCQPGFDCRRLVGGVIVHVDVDVQPFGDRAVDLFQEVEKLPGPVAPGGQGSEGPRPLPGPGALL